MNKHKIVIVGSGFSGICIGIKLKKAGIHDFIILEKASKLGGTWRENSYPGAECDIPSALYSYSFEPNPEWKHVWSKREQIFQYQLDVANKYNLMPHFRFEQSVKSAEWKGKQWLIQTQSGTHESQHFISAIGQLHELSTPQFKGSDKFNGHQFHAAKWDHSVDLSDKRVSVIGAAASAVQLIPEVAKIAKHLTVFQRTPNWMMEKPNRSYTRFERWLSATVPFFNKLYRGLLYLLADGVLYPALKGNKVAAWFVKFKVKRNLNKHIKDPVLKSKLTPDYAIGAKRILFSHTFYNALSRSNVDLQTEPISAIDANSIHTETGQCIETDVIVYATGFITNPFFKSIEVKGESQTLAQAWKNGAQAYLGMHTNGFPNLHMMYGPNTNLGHNSIIIMIEAQANYICKIIRQLDKQGQSSVDVKHEAECAYNAEVQDRLNRMVFSAIETSWYMDNGKITNNWAGSTWEYRRRLDASHSSAYNFSHD